MPARRDGVDHAGRDPATDQPILRDVVRDDPGQLFFDVIEALVEPVASVFHVMRAGVVRHERIARPHDVEPSKRDRIEAHEPCGLVHGRFDREVGLAQAVAAEGAARQRIGVNGEAVDPLVGTAVERERLARAVKHHAGTMVAVSTGVGQHSHGNCGQGAVVLGADLHVDPHRMAARRTRELFFPRIFEASRDGPS